MLAKIKNLMTLEKTKLDQVITEYIYVIRKNEEFVGVNEVDFEKNIGINSKVILKTIQKRKRRRRRRRRKRKID